MITVEVLDREGHGTGRMVDVFIAYTVSVDNAYGADTDGHRGERRVEYDIQDLTIAAPIKQTLLAEELAQVLYDAEQRFERVEKHW
jgi:hypothetical protein